MGSAAKRRTDAEIADIENQHRPLASHAFRRSAISEAMRSMPPMVRSSLRVIGEYSDAGPTPIRFECMSLVCRIVKLGTLFCSAAGSSPPTVPVRGSCCGSIELIVIP